MSELWTVLIITSMVIGLIPAYIAKNKGKDFYTWYAYGVLLFFFAMIHAIVLPEKKSVYETAKEGNHHTLAYDIAENKVPAKVISPPDAYRDSQVADIDCPVEIESYKIKIPEGIDKLFVNIKFKNLSTKTITAIKIKLLCYDTFLEPVSSGGTNVFEKVIQDIEVAPRSMFGEDKLIELQGFEDTRKIQIIVTSIHFCDGSRWDYNENNLITISVAPVEGRELENLQKVAGEDAVCYAKEEETFWLCVCGKANKPDSDNCLRCERIKYGVLQAFSNKIAVDKELLKIQHKREEKERLREEQLKEAERLKIKAEQTRREATLIKTRTRIALFKKVSVFAVPVLLIIAFVSLAFYYYVIPQSQYNRALALIESGNHEEAYNTLLGLGSYRDADSLINDNWYHYAKKLAEAGDYEESINLLISLSGYTDSDKLFIEYSYNYAESLLSEGKEYESLQYFGNAINYNDSKEIVNNIAINAMEAGERRLALLAMLALQDYQGYVDLLGANDPPIILGFNNILILEENGTLVAFGDNRHGKNEITDWSNIVAVEAGERHTVGLMSNGKVVATGDNSDDQCEVTDWENIIAISVGVYHTLGLKANGTVVATGNNGFGQCDVESWSNIVAVEAGERHTVGLMSNGRVVATGDNGYDQCEVTDWENIIAISVGLQHTVGLKANGTVVATGNNRTGQCLVSNWNDIISISAGSNHTVGLKTNGKVNASGYHDQKIVNGWNRIVAISANGRNTVSKKSDGAFILIGYIAEHTDLTDRLSFYGDF